MKKTILLLLALVLCLSMCACGGNAATQTDVSAEETVSQPDIEHDSSETEATAENTVPEEPQMTKEEMLQVAVEIDDYRTEMMDNIARAEAKYVGNVYYITGHVSDISNDHLNVGDFTVYLPTEDIIKVSTGQKITVVGKIDSVSYDEISDGWGGYILQCSGVMSNAYFVTDITEVTGTLTFYYMKLLDINGINQNRDGNPEAWVIGLDMSDDNVTEINYHMEESIPVNHVAGQNITTVQFGGQELANKTRITVSGKVFYDNGDYVIKEAELVSVG